MLLWLDMYQVNRSVLLAKMTHQPKHDLDVIHHKSSLYVCLVDIQYNCLCLGILMYGLVYPIADLGLLNGGFKSVTLNIKNVHSQVY